MSVVTKVIDTPPHGKGLQALQAIAQGTYVGTYVGEVLSARERRHRHGRDQELSDTYLMVFREHSQQGVQTTVVDARYFGRYVSICLKPERALCLATPTAFDAFKFGITATG